jgi:1-acyl-sn-glycerol-3-phosphate acyltransferase
MSLGFWIVTLTIKGLTTLLCDVDDAQLKRVPERGPLILVANHINFLEIPVIYTRLQPRPVTGLVKAETWNNPWLAVLFNLWGGIPIRRGEADHNALQKGLKALKRGDIVAIAPEGTRSGDGSLRPGHPGVALLALYSGAPVLPLVYFGGEKIKYNLAHLRRTSFRIAVGNTFYVQNPGGKTSRQVRQQITDEIMYQLALLLPPGYRGVYGDLEKATTATLRFV